MTTEWEESRIAVLDRVSQKEITISDAARELGVTRDTIYHRMRRYGKPLPKRHTLTRAERYKAQQSDPKTWPRYIWFTLRSRSKKRGIPFSISPEDIVVPEFCPVLGYKIAPSSGHDNIDQSPSVDRIVGELGYVKGNIRVISCRANLLKSNATIEELEAVVADLKRLKDVSL